MSEILKYSLGIDVDSEKFECVIKSIDNEQITKIKGSRKFKRSELKLLKHWIENKRKEDVSFTVTMEATGVYHEELAWFLHLEGYRVSVILPNQGKKYIESIGIKSKNDKIDAGGLAQMGAERSLRQWEPISNNIYRLRILTRHHEDLDKQKTSLINHLHANSLSRIKVKEVEDQLKELMVTIDQQIQKIKQEIETVIKEDPALKERVEKITKVKGLGVLTVATIIAETNGFAGFNNQKQLTSYAGYDVVENTSGKRVGKTRISKKGNTHIRRILHFAGMNTIRYQKGEFENLYQKILAKTNIKMKGQVAVQRKVLMLIYTLFKKNEEYDPNYYKKVTSGDQENKFSFHPDGEAINKTKAARRHSPAALGKLRFDLSNKVSFHPLTKIS